VSIAAALRPPSARVPALRGERKATVTVPLRQDSVHEATENLALVLTAPSVGLGVGSPAVGTVQIVDDDP
jgi:hypothetical protein